MFTLHQRENKEDSTLSLTSKYLFHIVLQVEKMENCEEVEDTECQLVPGQVPSHCSLSLEFNNNETNNLTNAIIQRSKYTRSASWCPGRFPHTAQLISLS